MYILYFKSSWFYRLDFMNLICYAPKFFIAVHKIVNLFGDEEADNRAQNEQNTKSGWNIFMFFNLTFIVDILFRSHGKIVLQRDSQNCLKEEDKKWLTLETVSCIDFFIHAVVIRLATASQAKEIQSNFELWKPEKSSSWLQ